MVSHKVDILAIGVHPDDVELSCMGTLLKHQAQGHRIGIVDLTKGELGSRGTATTRMQEAQSVQDKFSIPFRENLRMRDGFFQYNERNLLKIITAIRKYRPEIVLANAISDRHPDHGRAAKLIADACFYSGLTKIETQLQAKTQEHWRPKAVYHYIQDHNLTPDFVIDVTHFVDQKMEAILSYKTQFFQGTEEGIQTPISGEQFLEFIKAKMVSYGRIINAKYAEGFTVNRTMGINNLFDLI